MKFIILKMVQNPGQDEVRFDYLNNSNKRLSSLNIHLLYKD